LTHKPGYFQWLSYDYLDLLKEPKTCKQYKIIRQNDAPVVLWVSHIQKTPHHRRSKSSPRGRPRRPSVSDFLRLVYCADDPEMIGETTIFQIENSKIPH